MNSPAPDHMTGKYLNPGRLKQPSPLTTELTTSYHVLSTYCMQAQAKGLTHAHVGPTACQPGVERLSRANPEVSAYCVLSWGMH